jgi:iron only hydrogenase large subunit-like protein
MFLSSGHRCCSPDQVYHVSVMPCYDKKLEASRSDFYNEQYSTRDVDCVITTGELELLMRDKGWDLSAPVAGEEDDARPFVTPDEETLPEMLSHPGTSSGGYMQTLISTLIANSHSSEDVELSTKTVRGADYEEFTLTHKGTGEIIFRGAKCYGFRNLQNVVRKVGRDAGVQTSRGAAGRMVGGTRGRAVSRKAGATGSTPDKGYDYVEVMACPSGCVNGGGQLRPPAPVKDTEGYTREWEAEGVRASPHKPSTTDIDEGARIQGYAAKWGDREWTRKVEEAYWAGLSTPSSSTHSVGQASDQQVVWADELAARVARDLCGLASEEGFVSWGQTMNKTSDEKRRALFRTQYRAVESEVLGIAVKW